MGILINQANYQDIDALLWGWAWQWNTPNNHAVLTYSFPTSAQVYLDQGYDEVQGFQAFNATQVAAAVKILGNYDAVCNLDFVFTTDPYQGNIRLAEAAFFNDGNGFAHVNNTAYGFAPDNGLIPAWAQGDTWFNNPAVNPNGEDYNAPMPGNFAYAAGVMHEIGHAVGLAHGHEPQPTWDENGNVVFNKPALPANHDSQEYSIMTYRAYPGADLAITPEEYPSTLMQDDILALQWLYGANYDHNAGNTTYKWSPKTGEMFINSNGQGETFHHKIFMTVWDGGGVDTYDFSNYGSNASIDLTPGGWSTPSQAQLADLQLGPGVHLARGSIANAMNWAGDFRSYIENANGGSGNDSITGNEIVNRLNGGPGNDVIRGLAGHDTLIGSSGRDSLSGGSGRDLFDYNSISNSRPGSTHDTISDFTHGDDVDLRTIDARSGKGNQAFKWIGKQDFHGRKGELHYVDKGASCIVQGDVNGDGKADFEILIKIGALSAGDFLL